MKADVEFRAIRSTQALIIEDSFGLHSGLKVAPFSNVCQQRRDRRAIVGLKAVDQRATSIF